MVGSQIASLTPDPSFAHNLPYKCPNLQCEGILDIYASRPFQWHQEHPNARCFDPCCRALNIRESWKTPNLQLFQVLGFTPTLGQSGVATITNFIHCLIWLEIWLILVKKINLKTHISSNNVPISINERVSIFHLFINDYSRNTWTFFLLLKLITFEKFKTFKMLIELVRENQLKSFRVIVEMKFYRGVQHILWDAWNTTTTHHYKYTTSKWCNIKEKLTHFG